jgi:hypothetical protein
VPSGCGQCSTASPNAAIESVAPTFRSAVIAAFSPVLVFWLPDTPCSIRELTGTSKHKRRWM